MYKLSMAVVRYGASEYPLHGFPEFYSEKAVCGRLREYFPSDARMDHCQVVRVGPWPEVEMPETIVVRFPDNSVEVRYERLTEDQEVAEIEAQGRPESGLILAPCQRLE